MDEADERQAELQRLRDEAQCDDRAFEGRVSKRSAEHVLLQPMDWRDGEDERLEAVRRSLPPKPEPVVDLLEQRIAKIVEAEIDRRIAAAIKQQHKFTMDIVADALSKCFPGERQKLKTALSDSADAFRGKLDDALRALRCEISAVEVDLQVVLDEQRRLTGQPPVVLSARRLS